MSHNNRYAPDLPNPAMSATGSSGIWILGTLLATCAIIAAGYLFLQSLR